MRHRSGFFLAAALLAGMSALVSYADTPMTSHDESFSKEGLLKADVADLKDTRLVVTPDAPLPPATNVLWCGTLQLAWNEASDLVGEKLHFSTPSPEADLLNAGEFTRHDLDPSSYVALADFERNHVEDEIRAALERTFHGAASPELIPTPLPHPGPDDFVAYAYLYKNLAFAHPFKDGTLSFGNQQVEEFGFGSHADAGLSAQVSVCDYRSGDDFIVKLQTKSPGDELILAKVTPGATLQATMQDVLDRLAHHPSTKAGPQDVLSVPKLNFDLRRNFPELEGLTLVPGLEAKIKDKLVVAKVEQLVRFQLNEKGAVLKSEAAVVMYATAIMPHFELIFDKPFLILLRQAESPRAYFALWVGNASLLVPAKN